MLIINDRSFHGGSLQIDTTNHNRIQYWLHFILILQQSMWTILMLTWYRAQGTQSVLTLLCEHLAKSSSNLNLIFKTFSHPACCHHHAGRGLQGTRQCGHITSVAICAPLLPVPDCLRVAAPSLSLLGCLHPASSLPPHSTPCRYNNPAPWCSQSHFHTPCLIVRDIHPCNISLLCSICCSCHPLNTGLHLHLWSKFIKESPLRPIIGILWSIPWLPGAGAPLPLRPSYEVVSTGGCRGRFVFDFWTLLFSQRLSVAVAESATG